MPADSEGRGPDDPMRAAGKRQLQRSLTDPGTGHVQDITDDMEDMHLDSPGDRMEQDAGVPLAEQTNIARRLRRKTSCDAKLERNETGHPEPTSGHPLANGATAQTQLDSDEDDPDAYQSADDPQENPEPEHEQEVPRDGDGGTGSPGSCGDGGTGSPGSHQPAAPGNALSPESQDSSFPSPTAFWGPESPDLGAAQPTLPPGSVWGTPSPISPTATWEPPPHIHGDPPHRRPRTEHTAEVHQALCLVPPLWERPLDKLCNRHKADSPTSASAKDS